MQDIYVVIHLSYKNNGSIDSITSKVLQISNNYATIEKTIKQAETEILNYHRKILEDKPELERATYSIIPNANAQNTRISGTTQTDYISVSIINQEQYNKQSEDLVIGDYVTIKEESLAAYNRQIGASGTSSRPTVCRLINLNNTKATIFVGFGTENLNNLSYATGTFTISKEFLRKIIIK